MPTIYQTYLREKAAEKTVAVEFRLFLPAQRFRIKNINYLHIRVFFVLTWIS